MKTAKLLLNKSEIVKKFVSITSLYPYDMDLKYGRHVVDAKSLLGIFSLDLSKELLLEIHSDNCEDLLKELQPFMIK